MKIMIDDTVQDVVSGFKGIVMAITEWHNGCMRYEVQPKIKKDGTMADAYWIDG